MHSSYTFNLENGKYTVTYDYTGGGLTFLRHGEAWPAMDNLKYSKVIGAMATRIEELEQAIDQVLNGTLDARGERLKNGMSTQARLVGTLMTDWHDRLQAVLEQRP